MTPRNAPLPTDALEASDGAGKDEVTFSSENNGETGNNPGVLGEKGKSLIPDLACVLPSPNDY
jgi:hypothetical protein